MKREGLDLNLLIVLDHLAVEGTVSQAAVKLGVTQSAVSNALRRLRTHFGDSLFIPVAGRMEPTALAAILIDRIHTVQGELTEIAELRATFDPARSDRSFTVVTSDYVYLVLLAEAVRRLRKVAPGLSLKAILVSEHTPELLRQGRADFVIMPGQLLVDDHPSEPLFDDGYVCVVWSENSKVGEVLSHADYMSLGHVGSSMGNPHLVHLGEEVVERAGFERKIAAYAPTFTLVADTVVGTDLVATMHRRAAEIQAQRLPLRILPTPKRFKRVTEMLQWHRRKNDDPAITWMRGFLRETAATLDAPRPSHSSPQET